ncbi:MAG: hypothetical protein JXA46_05475 [Dehalococcoidales bacterium]|nr:hypothetical protein [Dehalococcoidales bacterium]
MKAIGYYEEDGIKNWLYPEDSMVTVASSPSQLEKVFPMSSTVESSIIHVELDCPVIVDGVKYEGNEISKFNGKRLYFIIASDSTLYAFTSVSGLEDYQVHLLNQPILRYDGIDSLFFKDVGYGGDSLAMIVGHGIYDLNSIGYDNALSSAKVTSLASWAYLYDYPDFQGDCLAIPGGVDVSSFVPYGWNDRASSLVIQ